MFWRFIGFLFGGGVLVALIVIVAAIYFVSDFSRNLPDYSVLKNYKPPVMTRIHASDGALIAEYAREKRLFQPIQTIPQQLKNAFISAEDKTFYSHGGVDPFGISRAAFRNVEDVISGRSRRMQGASTITQQVAKNFLLSNEQKYSRKVKEILLAFKIESTFSKEEILELYLNEILMGGNVYGVAAASLYYFNKTVHALSLGEMAYLAALPKGPNNYHPIKFKEKALIRRNWVIDRMLANGYISKEEAENGKAEDLVVNMNKGGQKILTAEYFSEEVRRELAKIYGNDTLYQEGLSVRTSLDPNLQVAARAALMRSLISYDKSLGFRGPYAKINIDSDDWGESLIKIPTLGDIPEWRSAIVLKVEDGTARVGLLPVSGRKEDYQRLETTNLTLEGAAWAKKGLKSLKTILNPGDIIYVEQVGEGTYSLAQKPEIEGGLVAMDPRTGRVLALVGGFSFSQSNFNRATQAKRQPGSSFKPIVYAAALDNGYTPSSVVMDAPITIENQDGSLWKPENYSSKFYGPQTLRRGIEFSRNVMTVRLAKDIGMQNISDYSKLFGVYDNLLPVLAMSLGAGETTVMRMTSAYATIANGGRKIQPTLIDRIQDRYGRTIYLHDERICQNCQATNWINQDEPEIIDNRDQILDPMTAYQITSMMSGVIERGTGRRVQELNRPVAGKTGTTNDYKDAWFIGFTPDMTVGVYVGYDKPKSMGKHATGGELAAPIFVDFMKVAMQGKTPLPFTVPLDMVPNWIDPKTGIQTVAGTPGAILEYFKPGTAPNTTISIIGEVSNESLQQFEELYNQNPEDGESVQTLNHGRGGLY